MAVEARAERAFTTSVGPTYFTAEEWAEVTAAVAPGALGLRSMHTRRTLKRLFAPMDDAVEHAAFGGMNCLRDPVSGVEVVMPEVGGATEQIVGRSFQACALVQVAVHGGLRFDTGTRLGRQPWQSITLENSLDGFGQ